MSTRPTQKIPNDLENQKKLLKKSLICRRTPKLLHQYMALHWYRKNHLEKLYENDLGSQIMVFLEDLLKIYPGWVNGIKKEGLFLLEIDSPTPESEGIEDLLPTKKMKESSIDDLIDNAAESEDEYVCG